MNRNVLWSVSGIVVCLLMSLILVKIKHVKLGNEHAKLNNELNELAKKYSNLRSKYEKLYFENKKSVSKTDKENESKSSKKSNLGYSSRKILFNFHLGMSKSDYNSLVKLYKKQGKMIIWDGSVYCMHWFNIPNVYINDKVFGNFSTNQSFHVIFDVQPKFVNDKLHMLSILIEPLYDDSLLIFSSSNYTMLNNYLSEIFGIKSTHRWTLPTFEAVLSKQKLRSKYYDKIYTYYRLTLTSV